MDRQPVLKGERLLLRPLQPADWEAFYAAASDPLIWEVHPAPNRWRAEECRKWFDGALVQGGALVVIDRASGELVGSSRYQDFDFGPDVAVIGATFLARSHWGGGANREMKRLMIAHALSARQRVWFLVGEDNLRSRKAVEKIGGRLIDRTHTEVLASGPVLHVIYEIDREGFTAGPLMS